MIQNSFIKDKDKVSYDEYFTLWVLIAQAKDALLSVREREYYQYNVTNERRAVLFAIAALGGQATPVEISRFLFRKINSVTEMIKRMEKEGLIKKYQTSGRTKVTVKITKKGFETYCQSLQNDSDKRILSILTKKQREQLAEYLLKLRNEAARELGIQSHSLVFSEDFHNGKKIADKC